MSFCIFFQYISCSRTSSSGVTAQAHLISSPWFSSSICLSGYHPLISSPGGSAAASSPLQFSDSCPKLLLLLKVQFMFSVLAFVGSSSVLPVHRRGNMESMRKSILFSQATVLGPGQLPITHNVLEHPAEEVLCMARV